MNHDRTAIRDALNVLIASPDARHLYNSLVTVAALQIAHPVWLGGEAEALNPLIDAYRNHREWFDRQMEKVDARRREALLAPLAPETDDGFDKVSYMREFMHTKRLRMRRAADIENLVRPARDRVIGRARTDFMDAQAAKWRAELDERVEAARESVGGRVPRETLDAVRQAFWDDVDARLDAAERDAHARLRK